jgi:hypothetical protein
MLWQKLEPDSQIEKPLSLFPNPQYELDLFIISLDIAACPHYAK